MATYVPGITDYIPQAQPFSPDYNFLGNMLQNAQTKYDTNYKNLSKTYGTLLNSPMLREDNIQQRDEFFKMIDQDIKKISGMDLSLQQNVDSANTVFESFYQNKEMVKDMVYTKEYQKQLEIGDNYRNCIDQEKCGGKYWDQGINALHYRADEFKKAGREDTLKMSPGRFTPFINVQEKAMLYAKDLLGKDGTFGVQTINWSPDGRYIITTKNGSNLAVPLEQLLVNQYSKDQAIIDMYQTSAYVNRKSFIQANAEAMGGEDIAEDEYFRLADQEVQNARAIYEQVQDLLTGTKARKEVLEREIKNNGSTGDDDLAFDFESSGVDYASAQVASDIEQETQIIANSIFDAGDNREMKRQRVDGMFSRSLMRKELSDSAATIAAMTGSVEVEVDPYAKSYYDFSLDMQKMRTQYDLMDRNELRKNIYEMSKNQVMEEYKFRGPAEQGSNTGTFVEGYAGTTSAEDKSDEAKEIQEEIIQHTTGAKKSALDYVNNYANNLMNIIETEGADMADKTLARQALTDIYGKAKRDANGNVVSPGYDQKTNKFIGPNGAVSNNPVEVAGYFNDWRGLYDKANTVSQRNKSLPFQKEYIQGDGLKYQQEFNMNEKMVAVSSKVWQENNLRIKDWGTTIVEPYMRKDWTENFFTTDGRKKTEEQYVADYVKAHANDTYGYTGSIPIPGIGQGAQKKFTYSELAEKGARSFQLMDDTYTKIYNGGNSVGVDGNGQRVPLIQPLHGSTDFGNMSGGKTSGGATVFDFNSTQPGSLGTRGLLTFYQDAVKPGSIFTLGNAGDTGINPTDLENSSAARSAYEQLVLDIANGSLTTAEKAVVGKVAYMDLALNDPNYAGIHVTFPETWLKRYKGTEDEPTWANGLLNSNTGVGVYINKESATNDFTRSFQSQPYDMILNHNNETISYSNAGDVTIQKRNADGSFSVRGEIWGWDANGQKEYFTMDKIYSPETGGQNLYESLNMWLQHINDINSGNEPVNNRIYNPSQLPNIQNQLQNMSGQNQQQDLNSMFLNQVNFNLNAIQ